MTLVSGDGEGKMYELLYGDPPETCTVIDDIVWSENPLNADVTMGNGAKKKSVPPLNLYQYHL